MHWIKSLIVNLVLNIATLAIVPILVLAWLIRVHTIEFLQARERARRQHLQARPRRALGGLHADRGHRRATALPTRPSPRF